MPRKAMPIQELVHQEYWTPPQVARVLGHGVDFWKAAFDDGRVKGHRGKMKQGSPRMIKAQSARAYLEMLDVSRRRSGVTGSHAQWLKDFRARNAQRSQHARENA